MSTPEGKVKNKVNKALAKYGAQVYRFMPVQMGYGAPALDYFLCAIGVFIAVETKVKGKKLTPRQVATKTQIENADGKVFVVDDDKSLKKLTEYLDEIICK